MGWVELGWDQMGDGRRKENAADASASTTKFSHCGEHDSRYSIQQIESLAPLLLLLCTRSLAHSLDSSLSLSPSLWLAVGRSVSLSVCVCVCLSSALGPLPSLLRCEPLLGRAAFSSCTFVVGLSPAQKYNYTILKRTSSTAASL